MSKTNQIAVGEVNKEDVQHELLSVYKPLPSSVRDTMINIIDRFHAEDINIKQAQDELTDILKDNKLDWVLKEKPDLFDW